MQISESNMLAKRGIRRRTNCMGLSTMSELLDAAKVLLVREGAKGFTLDRVAKEAQVTKGTLLYHFHTKNHLLTALINDYTDHLQEKLDEGKKAARASLKYRKDVDETLAGFIEWYREFRRQDLAYTAYGLKILALAAESSELKNRVRDWYLDVFTQVRKSACPQALEIVLTLEGLFFLRHFQVDVTTDEEVEALLEKLEKLL